MSKIENRDSSPVNRVLDAIMVDRIPNVVEAGMFMRMKYESAFGIYDHDAPDSPDVPWPLLYVSPREDLSKVDPLDFRLDQFAENRVFDIFGVSFPDVIKLPRAAYLKVIQSAKKHSAKATGGLGKELTTLEAVLRGQYARGQGPKQ